MLRTCLASSTIAPSALSDFRTVGRGGASSRLRRWAALRAAMISFKPGPKMLLEPLPEVAQDQWFEAAFEDGFGSNGLRQLLKMVLEGFRKTIGVRDPVAGDRDSGVGFRGSEAGLRGSLLRGFGAGLRSSGAGIPCFGAGLRGFSLGFEVPRLGFEVLAPKPRSPVQMRSGVRGSGPKPRSPTRMGSEREPRRL